jgi:transposase
MGNELPKFFEQILLLHIKTNITNGKIEGINSKLRGFTKRAFGFKRSKNLK